MSLARNFLDLNEKPRSKTRNLVSTLTGIVTLVLSILVGFNVIDIDQSTTLQGYALSLIDVGVVVYGVVVGIINMFFTADPPVEPTA